MPVCDHSSNLLAPQQRRIPGNAHKGIVSHVRPMRRGTSVQAEPAETLPTTLLSGLLDSLNMPALLSDRTGRIMAANERAKQYIENAEIRGHEVNLFSDLLQMDLAVVIGQVENG